MSNQLDRIVLGSEFHQYSVTNALDSKVLEPLSQINVLVGPNNSGKSRFMRQLTRVPKPHCVPRIDLVASSAEARTIRVLGEFTQAVLNHFNNRKLQEVNGILGALHPIHKLLEQKKPVTYALAAFLIRTSEMQQALTWKKSADANSLSDEQTAERANSVIAALRNEANARRDELRSHIKPFSIEPAFKTLYVPTLRTLRVIDEEKDVLEGRTIKDYFPQGKAPIAPPNIIFTGQSLYREVQRLLLGNLEERKRVRSFEKFIGDQFFEGQPLALIPKLENRALEVKIGNEREYPIQNLGDGIQSILTLTFPLFKHREEPLLVFYEEPEMFMHPGIQRIFLTCLQDFKHHQFFIATHSNHFLDITLDLDEVSVFTFHKKFDETPHDEKEAQFEIENVSSGHDSCLKLLGVRNSSVFLSNCTIWVEGITDRRYISHYLRLFCEEERKTQPSFKEFKEDLHYSFVEYGGANVTHWSFLDDTPDPINVDRLCSRLFLVADKDTFKSNGKAQRHEKLAQALGERFHLLECKEIENLLLVDVLKQVVESYEKGKPEFKDVQRKAYLTKALGTFIEGELLASPKTRRGSYAAESGTVSDKINFCDKAIAAMKTYDDISDEAKEIAKKVYEFIAANNS